MSTRCVSLIVMWVCAMSLTQVACKSMDANKKPDMEQVQDAEWHYKSGAGYFEGHQVPLAIRELHIAIKKDPDHAKSHYLLGFIYMGRRQYSKSVQHFKRVIELEPTSYDAINSLGATYLAMERWDEAVVLFEQLLEEPMFITPELAHNNAGWAYYKQDNYNIALEHFKMAVFLKPGFCLGYNNLGLTQTALRQRQDAMKSYSKAIELCPTAYAEPHFHLAKAYLDYGDQGTARNHFAECVKLAAGSQLADRCQEYLNY